MRRLDPKELKEAILGQGPTQEQQDAIFAPELEFLLRACPGSGKTWTTCRRFLWRVANWSDLAGGLAMLSFTNAAVKEFKHATAKIGRGALHEPHFVGTLDSFIERFVMGPFGHLITGIRERPKVFVSPRPGDLKNSKLSLNVKTTTGRMMPVHAWQIQPRLLEGKLGFYARPRFQDVELNKNDALLVMNELLRHGRYSQSQRAFWACHLFRKFPSIAKTIARRFPEVIVDEAQDTGSWLLRFLQHLRDAGSKITLVGDPDQCIYEFGQASVTTLANCKKDWKLIERPLNKSFRCNDVIAAAVRQISGNLKFQGCGPARSELEGAYVFSDSTEGFVAALEAFKKRAAAIGLKNSDCAILCRAHEQMVKMRGVVRYKELQGRTKRLAEAAFMRDGLGDFAGAMKETMEVLSEICVEDSLWTKIEQTPASELAIKTRTSIWRYLRSNEGLPSVAATGAEWLPRLRTSVEALLKELGIEKIPNIAVQLRKTGVTDSQLPLFSPEQVFPELRFDTIHKAKGESISAVLFVGGKRFFDQFAKDVSDGAESEDKRLGYVAMTRARHLLCVAIPAAHFVKYSGFWKERGFKELG
jgi:superfamily I DNA/RNA helicase